MTVQDSRQAPLFDVRSFRTDPYEFGSFFWMLEHFGHLIIFRDDFPQADPALGGKPQWCPVLKSKLVLIHRRATPIIRLSTPTTSTRVFRYRS